MRQLVVLISAILFTNMAFSQGGGSVDSNKVIVVTQFNPTIKDANKILFAPLSEDTVYKAPNFEYKIYESKYNTPFNITPIKPAKMSGEPLDKLYANHLAVGMGNYTTPYFEFYHSKLRSRQWNYGIHLKHMSSAGEIEDYAYPGFSNNLAEVYGKRMYKKSLLETEVAYKRDVVHFYGFEKNDSIFNTIDYPTDNDIKQTYNSVLAKANWSRYKVKQSEVDYDADLSYYYIGDKYKTTEHNVSFNSRIDWGASLLEKMFRDERIGATLDFDLYNNSWDTLSAENTFIIGIQPFYTLRSKQLDIKLGVLGNVVTDSNSTMNFFPQLDVNYKAIEDILFMNFGWKGGVVKNNLMDLSNENQFISSHLNMEVSKLKTALNFGLGSSISNKINFNFQLHYENWENAPLFVTDTSEILLNKFNVIYDDYSMVKFNLGIAYQKMEHLNIILNSNYYIYNMTNELYAWHKPEFDIRLDVRYNIKNKFIIESGLILNGESKVPVLVNNVIQPQTLKGWIDFNLGFEYRYNKKIAAFVNLNNIAASRYYRWYNYPSFRFNAIGGIKYIF